MKKLFIIIIALGLSITSFSQGKNDIGKIALSLVMPENVDGLDASQLTKLGTKITQIVTKSGLAASGYNNSFVIYPIFAVYDTEVVEGGMQNITVVTAEVTLFIKQVDNNVVFSTISKSLKGSGSNKQKAITNSISKISINDPSYTAFIETGKTKIIQYYESKCSDIINKSDGYVKMQQYEQALGLLMTVPEEVSDCYYQVQDKAIEAYKAYQNQQCTELILKAKTTLAANDYIETLYILAEIDPSTSCYNEALVLAKSAETKVDAEAKQKWDFQMQQYNDDISLRNKRIDAVKEIAVSYFNNQNTTTKYDKLVSR